MPARALAARVRPHPHHLPALPGLTAHARPVTAGISPGGEGPPVLTLAGSHAPHHPAHLPITTSDLAAARPTRDHRQTGPPPRSPRGATQGHADRRPVPPHTGTATRTPELGSGDPAHRSGAPARSVPGRRKAAARRRTPQPPAPRPGAQPGQAMKCRSLNQRGAVTGAAARHASHRTRRSAWS